MSPNKTAVPVFTIQKKHAWRDQIIRWVSVGLVIVVLAGTLIWLLVSARFSFGNFFSDQIQRLKPEIKQEKVKENLTPEQELIILIEERKVLQIDSISQTAEGDLQLRSKEGTVVIFAVEKSLTDQLTTLQTLLTKAKIDNKALKKVDFRFEKIVIEY